MCYWPFCRDVIPELIFEDPGMDCHVAEFILSKEPRIHHEILHLSIVRWCPASNKCGAQDGEFTEMVPLFLKFL